MNENNFVPKVIGLPDTKKADQITTLYSEICTDSNSLFWSMETYLDCFDKLELTEFLNFLGEKDPKAWLYLKYIEYHGLKFPGIAISKIIEYQLVDVPVNHFEDILKSRAALMAKIEMTKEFQFVYPLAKLFVIAEGYQGFAITIMNSGLVATEFDTFEFKHTTPDFDETLYNHVRKFTASESDNVVLEAIEEAIDSFNKLIRLGVIKNGKGNWINGISNLTNAIVFNVQNAEHPLSVNPMVCRHRDFRRFFSEPSFKPVMGQPQNILKFEAPAPAKSEDILEDLLPNEGLGAEQIGEIPEEIIKTE